MSQSDEQKGEKSSDEDNENNEGKNKKPEEKLVSDKEKQFPEERESNEEECYDQTEIKVELFTEQLTQWACWADTLGFVCTHCCFFFFFLVGR